MQQIVWFWKQKILTGSIHETITSSGINKEMYQRYESGTTYRFIGAYIATTSRDEYSLVDSNKVTKLMGKKRKRIPIVEYEVSV